MQGNAVIGQSGGPTAVINQSLVGVVEGLRSAQGVEKMLGMRHGVRGLVSGELVRLDTMDQAALDRVANTPSAALGSTRDKPDGAYCERILEGCKKHNVRQFFYIGGNDSSDTCRLVNELAKQSGYDMHCFHVPKTIDNDLMKNDHTPGFASAARYVAMAFMGDNLDNASIPGVKINVVMGRHAGFLVGASALLREREDDGPHLVCVPERTFDMDTFVGRVEDCMSRFGRCQIALSEGVQDKDGNAIGATLIAGDTDAHGNAQLSGSGALGDQMAMVLKKRLTPVGGTPLRVRADTLGYQQRCYPDASPIDAQEARQAGVFAAKLMKNGERDGSVAIVRTSDAPYASEMQRVELTDVAAKTRHMPDDFLDGDFNVSDAFIEWLRPLVGPMPVAGRV